MCKLVCSFTKLIQPFEKEHLQFNSSWIARWRVEERLRCYQIFRKIWHDLCVLGLGEGKNSWRALLGTSQEEGMNQEREKKKNKK
jgi:hypothetical protein